LNAFARLQVAFGESVALARPSFDALRPREGEIHHAARAILNVVVQQAVVFEGKVARPPPIYPSRDEHRAAQLS
jgi:hypothetical protein